MKNRLFTPVTGEPRVARRHSDTAEANATMRAAESLLSVQRRLLLDPFARDLVRRPAYRLLSRWRWLAQPALRTFDRRYPGLHGHIVLRARYADDMIARSASAGITQLVILGAGFDTTAYRHHAPRLTVFEVDAPATQQVKRQRIQAAGHVPATALVYVPCDFTTDRLGQRLVDAAFDVRRPALFSWLGVTCYLTMEEMSGALADLGTISAPRSRIVLDCIDPSVVDGTTPHLGARRVAEMVDRRGEPYRLGLTPATLSGVLAGCGFALDEYVGLPELAARYPAPAAVWCSINGWQYVAAATRR
jgi:methyltransferase (TIGR00027 family)